MSSTSAICKAQGGPANCRFHSAVYRLYSAQMQQRWEDAFYILQEIRDLEASGWNEDSEASDFFSVDTSNIVPVTRTQSTAPSTAASGPPSAPSQRKGSASTENPAAPPLPVVQVTLPGHNYTSTFKRFKSGEIEDFKYIRVQTNRKITPYEARSLAGMLGYTWRAKVGPNKVGEPFLDSPNSFVVQADFSSRDRKGEPEELISQVEDYFPTLLKDGSPIRTRGAESGTRKIAGLGQQAPSVALYYGK